MWVKTHPQFLLKSLSEPSMTVTVSMSAVWLKLITILCLYCAALTDTAIKGVEWRDFGEAVTIQCRAERDHEYMYLMMGLSEENQVFFMENKSKKSIIAKEFIGRLQTNGAFPNMDILINNLTSKDTGPYWCVYKRFEKTSMTTKTVKGTGSVLLVVKGDRKEDCDQSHLNLTVVAVSISATVLLAIITGFIIWIILKTKSTRTTVRPRRVATNDVYEDMRGTLRR